MHSISNTGEVDALYVNGNEKTKVSDTPDSNGEWQYYNATNTTLYYDSSYTSTTINEQMIEAGEDFTSFVSTSLVDASLELHNYLDRRYSTPLLKVNQIDFLM